MFGKKKETYADRRREFYFIVATEFPTWEHQEFPDVWREVVVWITGKIIEHGRRLEIKPEDQREYIEKLWRLGNGWARIETRKQAEAEGRSIRNVYTEIDEVMFELRDYAENIGVQLNFPSFPD